MEESFIRQLVWLDFRLALIFTVFLPLVLLIWAFKAKSKAIQRSLIIYWRVASLLAITVYMMIGSLPISFLAGLVARILIPVSLWFWEDLNEDINAMRSSLKPLYKAWRWAVTTYCAIGAGISLVFSNCAFAPFEKQSSICKIWFEPPLGYKDIFHHGIEPEKLAFFGIVGLIVYGLYLAAFVAFSLPKQGRIAFRE
ncbi:DUF3177 family protein [Tumidithrix elongata RA019]|uniref:DUF3177 family protein n=1 Tax=Tumidithrix elongata BACA0141 TaxID=2716417 RepID=A0AAW9PUL9_9CYAN|nr:DUF3177 family protein [Tumidithrix elongata RA019]